MKLGIKNLLTQSAQKVKQRLGLESLTWGEYLSKLDEALSGIWPSGSITVEENGTYNVREIETVNVNVEQTPILQQITVTQNCEKGVDIKNFFTPYIEEGQTGFFLRRQDDAYGAHKVMAIFFIEGVIRWNGIMKWSNSYSYTLVEPTSSYTAKIDAGSIFEKVVTDGPHITT